MGLMYSISIFYTIIYHFHLFNHSKGIRMIILYFFIKRKQHAYSQVKICRISDQINTKNNTAYRCKPCIKQQSPIFYRKSNMFLNK